MKLAILIMLALACASYFGALPLRNEIEAKICPLVVPERMTTGYTGEQLAAFAKAATITHSNGRTALESYRRPVLIPLDLIFAVCFGAFVVLLGLDLARHTVGLWRFLCLVSAGLGLVYAMSDVAEDLTLARILSVPDTNGAQVASALTRTKVVALIGSGSGGLTFLALRYIGDKAMRSPGCQHREARLE